MSFFVLFWDDAYEVQVIDNCFNRKVLHRVERCLELHIGVFGSRILGLCGVPNRLGGSFFTAVSCCRCLAPVVVRRLTAKAFWVARGHRLVSWATADPHRVYCLTPPPRCALRRATHWNGSPLIELVVPEGKVYAARGSKRQNDPRFLRHVQWVVRSLIWLARFIVVNSVADEQTGRTS